MAISQETRDWAKELYVIEGFTFEEVSEQTKVPVGTLKRWAKEEEWQRKREEYQADRQGFKESLGELRDLMLKKALGSLDPQDIYPLVALEKLLTARMQPGGSPGEESEDEKKMTPEELLKFIKEKVYGLSG